MDLKIRWMKRDDMDGVAEIRAQCGIRSPSLDRMVSDPKCICKVAEIDGKPSGFMCYRNGKKNVKVLEVSVGRRFRRMGVASSILSSLSARLNLSLKEIEMTVGEENLPAQMMLKKAGFLAVEMVDSKDGIGYKFKKRKEDVEKSSSDGSRGIHRSPLS